MSELTPLSREILAVIAALADGEVVSYGDVAHDAGRPGAGRSVGAVLARTDAHVPWWRVVRADGRLVTRDPRRQAARLRAEGVTIREGRVVSAPSGRFAGRASGAGQVGAR